MLQNLVMEHSLVVLTQPCMFCKVATVQFTLVSLTYCGHRLIPPCHETQRTGGPADGWAGQGPWTGTEIISSRNGKQWCKQTSFGKASLSGGYMLIGVVGRIRSVLNLHHSAMFKHPPNIFEF